MSVRDRRMWFLLGPVLALILALVIYLPIALAWSSREDVAKAYEEYPNQQFTVVGRNWPMRVLPYLYDPLIRFHASMRGWSFFGEQRELAYPDPEVVSAVFSRSKPSDQPLK